MRNNGEKFRFQRFINTPLLLLLLVVQVPLLNLLLIGLATSLVLITHI